jgi:hypothetical protein
MFCIARVGAQIYDTALISPVDRHSTDVTFNDVLLFRQPSMLNITSKRNNTVAVRIGEQWIKLPEMEFSNDFFIRSFWA